MYVCHVPFVCRKAPNFEEPHVPPPPQWDAERRRECGHEIPCVTGAKVSQTVVRIRGMTTESCKYMWMRVLLD